MTFVICPVLAQGTYFVMNRGLYYVVDVEYSHDVWLIENCKTDECFWMPSEELIDDIEVIGHT
jgi:hypothetical protein